MRLRIKIERKRIKAKFRHVVSSGGGGGGGTWGTITGIITNQIDLVNYIASSLIGYATQAWVLAQGYVSNVLAVTLTGLNLTLTGAITATDTIIDAFGKLQNQINNLFTLLAGKEDAFTILPINKGGTNSGATLNNNRIMQSSGGAIVEAPAITANRVLVSNANGIPVASTLGGSDLLNSIVYTWTNTSVFTQGQRFTFTSLFGDIRIYEVLPGQTLNAGETPHTNPEKVVLINNNWLDCEMVQRWHTTQTYTNFTKVLSFDNAAVNPLSSATPIVGNGQTISKLACRIQTAQTSGSIGRMSLYRINTKVNAGTHAFTAQLIHDGGTFTTDTAGVKTVTIPTTTLYKGELYVVVITNTNTSGSWQRMSFDLSFLGFGLSPSGISRTFHFIAYTITNAGITDATLPAQSTIRIVPSTMSLHTAFVR